MISKKSELFKEWIERNAEDIEDVVIPLVVELEANARILEHVHALCGDIDQRALKGLFETVRKLQEAYGTETV